MRKQVESRWFVRHRSLALLAMLVLFGSSTLVIEALSETFTATNIVATSTMTTPAYTVTGGTNPTITVCNASPPTAVAPAGSECLDAVGSAIYVSSGGGAWAQVSVVGGAVGSLAVATTDMGSLTYTINLSTEGTIDWFAPLNVANLGRQWSHGVIGGDAHEKASGPGWLTDGTQGVHCGNGFAMTQISGAHMNSTDSASSGELVNSVGTLVCQNGDTLGYGWRVAIPATTHQQVLRIYGETMNNVATCSAHLTDGSAVDASATFTTAVCDSSCANANCHKGYVCTVTFKSAGPAWLIVTMKATSLLSGFCGTSVAFTADTLAPT